MDSDRWSAAWTSLTASKMTGDSTNTDNKGTEEQPSRYRYDMAQAKAMQRASSSSSKNKKSSSTSPVTTMEDVNLGFLGLEQAERYADRGELEEALRLYELAIELLIRFLRGNVSSGAQQEIDRTTVEARVQVALSDAEAIKERIKGKKTRISPPRQQVPAQSTKERPRWSNKSSSPTTSLANSLQSALTRGKAAMYPKQSQPSNKPITRAVRRTVGTPVAASTTPPTASTALLDANSSDTLTATVYTDIVVDPATFSKVTWNDIAGLAQVKQSLQEAAVLPLCRPDLYTGLRKAQNVLLYGPPGTGKTMLVRAVASESASTLLVCSAATLTSKWMGEAEKLVRCVFQVAAAQAPSLIFLDEIDAILSQRKSEEHEASRRLKTEFMTAMDGPVNKNTTETDTDASTNQGHVLVLACTNCPWDIDSAVLRRFPRRIFVPLPDDEARKALLKSLLAKAGKHALKARDIAKLVERTKGFSGSDVSAIATQAAFGPLRSVGDLKAIQNCRAKDVRPISLKDFQDVIAQTTKSVSADQLRRYDDWQRDQAA